MGSKDLDGFSDDVIKDNNNVASKVANRDGERTNVLALVVEDMNKSKQGTKEKGKDVATTSQTEFAKKKGQSLPTSS